ncbi:MAG TPA: hypothetical protein VD835_16290 [Pyrinomonadaceae bacterium]|nr:hypothetical protein [Pyrinomonadaceae bacterium]
MLEGSQEFALSLPEHDSDSSGLMAKVKNKVSTVGASRPISFQLNKLACPLARPAMDILNERHEK